MHLRSTSIIKITVKKMAISPECFVCFRWDLQNWKEQSFNLTIGMEGITQLLKSNFEQSKCKWRHQCHAFSKKGTFFLNMSTFKYVLYGNFFQILKLENIRCTITSHPVLKIVPQGSYISSQSWMNPFANEGSNMTCSFKVMFGVL